MNVNIAPSVFVGKLHQSSEQQKQEYFSELSTFFKDYKDSNILIVESVNDCSQDEFVVSYRDEFRDIDSLKLLESIVLEFKTSKKIKNTFSEFLTDFCSSLQLNTNKIIYLALNETRSQVLMELGQKLQKMRQGNYVLVGLGNVTNKAKTNKNEITKAVKEFDSWVRVKLWEFDYYALRDIETYFPMEKSLYLDDVHSYGPFLVVFGSLIGTDVLYDLYTGFEDNTSLRSFYFTT